MLYRRNKVSYCTGKEGKKMIIKKIYICGNCSIGVANLKSSGNSLAAAGYINLYDCRIVTSATPAISPISF